jgi:Na+-transporting NADH:ubiquinone oxidoreductase subunit NqrE
MTNLLLSSTGLSQYMGVRYMSTVMWFVPFILQVYCLFPVVEWLLDRVHPALLQVLAFAVSLLLIAVVFHAFPARALDVRRSFDYPRLSSVLCWPDG